MNRLNPRSCGLVVAVFLIVVHAAWSLLVAFGVAQWLMDLIFKLHMITPPYEIASFNLGLALGLLVMTGLFGYLFGWLFGVVWNKYAAK